MSNSLQDLVPLPQRAIPQPWEDLASVLSRAARKMGYPHPKWIIQAASIEHRIEPEALPLLSASADYQMLGKLLRLDKEKLVALTLHRFAPRLQKPNFSVPLTDQTSGRHMTYSRFLDDPYLFSHTKKNTISVCPHCLDEPDAYDRLYWRISPLFSCPRHRVFLRRVCPACQAPIPALRPYPYRCPSCRSGDYRSFAVPVPGNVCWLEASQTILLDQLGVERSEQGEAFIPGGFSLLQQLPSQDYLELVSTLSYLLLSHGQAVFSFLSRTLPLAIIIPQRVANYHLLLHYMLAYWPTHFWIVLELIQRALQYDSSPFENARQFLQPWNEVLERGDYWREEVYRERTIELVDQFVTIVGEYFKYYRWRGWHLDHPYGEEIAQEGSILADQLKQPMSAEMVKPYPWEDLTSVLRRVAINMSYQHPGWMLITRDTPRQKVHAPNLLLLHHDADYLVLERQLGLDEVTLYQHTLHRWREILLPLDAPQSADVPHTTTHDTVRHYFTQAQAEDFCLPLEYTRVCPACLDEVEAYDRLFWRLHTVLLCPRHTLFLVDRCPDCFAPIPAFRSSHTRCPYCGRGEYHQAQHQQVALTSWLYAGQSLILGLLTEGENLGHDGTLSFAKSPLVQLQPWQYFSLLNAFHLHFLSLPYNSVLLHSLSMSFNHAEQNECMSLSAQAMGMHIAFFHFLLSDWPRHLREVLECCTSILKSNKIGWPVFTFYDSIDKLIQSLYQQSQQTLNDPYLFVKHVLEKLSFWGVLLKLPNKQAPLPSSYFEAKWKQILEYNKSKGISIFDKRSLSIL
jgi:hypothetical protein